MGAVLTATVYWRRVTCGFRRVKLNVVGWVALLVPGGLAGMLLALFNGLPPLLGVMVDGLVAWATALVLDSKVRGFPPWHVAFGFSLFVWLLRR